MEIEIKLLLPPNCCSKRLCDWRWPALLEATSNDTLGNIYFDTDQQILRKKDMGLRIRRKGTQQEMTLKTAGEVVGGMHARPEYNVDVVSDRPDLSLFPAGIFADDEVALINAQLQPQFATDFVRQKGELQIVDAVVEVALDQGEILAGEQSLTIAELELELISGDAKSLLPLVAEVMQQQPLRLGLDSKAARGYRLAQLQPAAAVVTQWQETPAAVLSAWQRNEERLLCGDQQALAPLLSLWQQAQQWQSQPQWLARAQQQLAASEVPQSTLVELLQQRQYGLTQLALLTAWLQSN
ncbi:inorganic triphosphatase [Ferrimonas lipolytica]|uniref:CYTH domain-containing protein n=1 Tax=Ferrimonas lipolytica TaxID=2724191 RepID=A0A6H1UHQ0_9GAMM|nr:CYTH domain-containing protein [Ferrimonas lipolytica]QIZ77746.1 CYTH domain-containing protein [Ferrimonas lipolytica]